MRTQIRQLVAGIGIVILFAVSPVGAAISLDQNQPTVNSAFGFDPLGTFDMGQLAQSFKPANGNVAGAGILMGKSVDSVSVSITIELWDNLPSLGGVCLASGSASYNGGNPGSWIDVSWAPVSVTPEATYYLIFKTSNTPYYGIAGNVNVYARGALYIGGTAYPYDFAFRTYYQTNTPPVAVDDSLLVQINSTATINVLANDSDADEGDVLSIVEFTQGANGGVTAGEGGLTYTPDLDFHGTDSFTYIIKDSKNATATATVTVTVNKAPVAAPDAGQTEVGLAITIPVLANDLDGDGDVLTVTAVGAATNGSVTLNSNGTVTYTPNAKFAGQDEFSYGISDAKGGTSTAEVYIVVNPKDVLIDIKPGSYPNTINLGSNGVVPLAILSTPDFDATTVDPASVSLAGADVAVRGKGNRYMASNQDVNADGRLDLVLHVETENLVPEELQGGFGTVVGKTYGGVPIIGTDEIVIVPQ